MNGSKCRFRLTTTERTREASKTEKFTLNSLHQRMKREKRFLKTLQTVL